MQHQRAGCLDNRAVKIVEIAKQIAIQETKQRDISDCRAARRLFYHLRITVVADAFFRLCHNHRQNATSALFAAPADGDQRHSRRAAFRQPYIKLQNIHVLTFTRAFSPTTSAWSGILSSTTLPAPIVT